MKHLGNIVTVIMVLIVSFFALSIGSAMSESLTYDEIVHIEEGMNAWKKKEFLIDTNNPPLIRELAVIPLLISSPNESYQGLPNQRVFPARMVIFFLSLVLAYVLYRTVNNFFGISSAVFALAIYCADVNILAYNHYVTQDLGSALFFFLGYISLISLLQFPSWKTFVWHGVCMGLLAATKITLLPYYALSAVFIVPYMLWNTGRIWIKTYWIHIAASAMVCALVLWSTYFFRMNVIIIPNDTAGRMSEKVEQYATTHKNQLLLDGLHFLRYTPVPLGDYIAAIKNTLVRSTMGTPVFFQGAYYNKPGWYFMLSNFLFKTPIPLLLLSIIGVWFGLQSSHSRKNTIIVIVPIISILLVNALSPMQPYIRYILPVYPFLFILAAIAYSPEESLRKYLTLLLYAWCVVGVYRQYPHFISYANEIAGPRELRYQKFSDSNIDWGQGLITLSNIVATERPARIRFSYFGRDDASPYGFKSTDSYGSYKSNEICAFHDVVYPEYSGEVMTIISTSNWYDCGYFRQKEFSQKNITHVVADSFLVFFK